MRFVHQPRNHESTKSNPVVRFSWFRVFVADQPRFTWLLVKVESDPESALQPGIDYATEQCEALIRFGVPGIHFYSLNKARSVMAISKNLSLTAPA